jgi:ferric enterobactin receptor
VKPRVYGDINLLSGNITAELPLSRKLTMIAAVRRSYSDIYSTGFSDGLFERNMDLFRGDSSNIVIQTKPKFYFFDYNAKITYKIRNLENLSISIYGGKDYFNNTYSGDSRSLFIEETDLNVWSNYGISASWQKQWDESFFSNLQIGTSGYSNTYTKNTTIDRTQSPDTGSIFLPDPVNAFNTFDRNELDDIYLTLRNTYKVSNNNQLNFGILTRRNTIYYHKDADKVYVYDNTYQSGWTCSGYIQDRISLSDKLFLKPGIRLSYFVGKKKLFTEPRFSINYKPSESLSLRLATGRYYQFVNQVMAQQETGYNKNFWIMADDSLHQEVSSNHFIIGMTAEKGKLLFDAEAYYKSFRGLQEYVFISPFRKNSDFHDIFKPPDPDQPDRVPPSFFITGRGRSYGVDLMLKYRGSVYTSWLSYSWGRSLHNFRDINNDQSVPAPNDLPYQLSWTNMLSVGKWNFGSVTLYSSGKPYIDFAETSMTRPFTRVYKRLPDYFRCDLSANYNFSIRKSNFKTGITFINIFNTQNYFDINTNKFDFNNTTFSEITLIQSQSFSVNLFLYFTF